jgi:FkbM family methyltransferase
LLREMVIRNTRTLNKLTSPKLVNSISKYMYIRKLIDEFEISLILDVGANIGQFGTSMRELGYTGTLVSFEPVAAQFAKLKAAASGDPNWITLNCAAGVADETKSINVMSSSVFSSFNAPSKLQTSRFAETNAVVATESVKVRRLDGFIDEFGMRGKLKHCFLKSDTQGFDQNVLEGMGSYLNEVRVLQLEISVTPIYENTVGMTDMLVYLQDRSFAPVALFPINWLADWSAIELDYLGVNRSYDRAQAQ